MATQNPIGGRTKTNNCVVARSSRVVEDVGRRHSRVGTPKYVTQTPRSYQLSPSLQNRPVRNHCTPVEHKNRGISPSPPRIHQMRSRGGCMAEIESNLKLAPQIFGDQPIILRRLAELSTGEGSRFLEVGSWYGDSTLIIGQVAREKKGHLFCVDWWKGNPGTELDEIAKKKDVFALFWHRMQSAGLEDVVIPIRSRSDFVCNLLAKETFSFIFIDGDHRYQGVLEDIRNYAPLVKRGGILCGHDCEGYVSDFDRGFLERGRDVDYYETVYCGVVLGVGQSFKKYSISNSIWSVMSVGKGKWKPTNIDLPGLQHKSQEPPPPITSINEYHVFRYRKKLYAVPFCLRLTDITEESLREHPDVIESDSLHAAKEQIHKRINSSLAAPPIQDTPETLGAVSVLALEQVMGAPVSDSPLLIESYREFNLVAFKREIYGIAHLLGPIHLAELARDELDKHLTGGTCVIGQSVEHTKLKIDKLYLITLEKKIAVMEREIVALRQSNETLEVEISFLEQARVQKEEKMEELYRTLYEEERMRTELENQFHAQRGLLSEKQAECESLYRSIAEREGAATELQQALQAREALLSEKQSKNEEQEAEIKLLKIEIEKTQNALELSHLR